MKAQITIRRLQATVMSRPMLHPGLTPPGDPNNLLPPSSRRGGYMQRRSPGVSYSSSPLHLSVFEVEMASVKTMALLLSPRFGSALAFFSTRDGA